MKEEWRDIKGYEGLYQISNKGGFKRLDKYVIDKKGVNRFFPEEILNGYFEKDRYHQAVLSKEGKKKTFYIHRLVAQAFIPNPENKPEINHKDGNKFNNNVKNLEWNTSKENSQHAFYNNLVRIPVGEERNSILTEKEVIKIHEEYSNGVSCPELAKKYNVNGRNINNIINGKRWSYLGLNSNRGFAKGERVGNSKLKEEDIIKIRKLYIKGIRLSKITKIYNIHRSTIHNIVTRRTWSHVK